MYYTDGPDRIAMAAGYMITSLHAQPAPVDQLTISGMSQTTGAMVQQWSNELIKKLHKYLPNVEVSEGELSKILLASVKVAMTCRRTTEENCRKLVTISDTVSAPVEKKTSCEMDTCGEFWMGVVNASSLADLESATKDAACESPKYYFNRLYARMPLCKMTCNDCVKYVYSTFAIQDNAHRDKGCMASAIGSWYSASWDVPDCGPDVLEEDGPFKPTYQKIKDGSNQKYAGVQKISAACGGAPDYAYFDLSGVTEDSMTC